MSEKKVKIIEPNSLNIEGKEKINVAAYARVSTDTDEQKVSFNNQKKEYETKIKSNPNYNFVGVFGDEGISGTTDQRPSFQRMIRLAELGYINLIYTKSISRFTRSVTDLRNYCKILKDHNVNVIFEEENIELLSAAGTFMLTLLCSVSEMEANNIREHVTHTLHWMMKDGKIVGRPNPLGYDFIDGQIVVNEEEAETVRYIFKRYLEGAGATKIGRELQSMGIKTKKGNSSWSNSTIHSILKNEIYIGKLVQGKTYTTKGEQHTRKRNHGDSRLYEREDNHEAIISLEDFERVQEIINSRCETYNGKKKGSTKNFKFNPFTSKIVCAYCGKKFMRRKAHPNTKYEKVIWKCSTKCEKGKACCPNSVAIEEDYLKQSVVGVIKDLLDDNEHMFYLSNERLQSLLQQSEKEKDRIEEQIVKCQKNIEAKMKTKDKLLDMFLEGKITEEQYDSRSADIDRDIATAQELFEELTSLIQLEDIKNNTNVQISKLIGEGKAEGFSEELFNLIIDKIIVGGCRSDGVDDPKVLHFELIPDNLDTNLRPRITEEGILVHSPRYGLRLDSEEPITDEDVKKNDTELYTSYPHNICCRHGY